MKQHLLRLKLIRHPAVCSQTPYCCIQSQRCSYNCPAEAISFIKKEVAWKLQLTLQTEVSRLCTVNGNICFCLCTELDVRGEVTRTVANSKIKRL